MRLPHLGGVPQLSTQGDYTPTPTVSHGPGSGSGDKSAETRGRRVWTSPCYRAACTTEHMFAHISQPSPSKHDDTKQQPSTHPRTQEHMELRLRQHFATHTDPSCSLHKATNHILDWIGPAKAMVPKQAMRKHGVTVFGQARARTRGGGVQRGNSVPELHALSSVCRLFCQQSFP